MPVVPSRWRAGRRPAAELSAARLDGLRRQFEDSAARRGGEASAAGRAAELAGLYASLGPDGRRAYLRLLAEEFGTTRAAIEAARQSLHAAADDGAQVARAALQPRWLTILRQFNVLPDGTKFLVDLRADLVGLAAGEEALRPLERDLKELLATLFDAGFLELRRITWRSPAVLLERLADSEAVHAVAGWNDLKNRLDPADRRFFAFFHPQLADEPLVFVQVGLRRGLAHEITPLLDPAAPHEDPARADTAIFYSISNAQPGLAGISLGAFLIKRVVDELRRELPRLKRFATLSPIPAFRGWLDEQPQSDLPLEGLCARYLLEAKRPDGRVLDPVANFHLSNGARIERINVDADPSERGMRESLGLMVNYLYELDRIEANHEAYATDRTVAAASGIARLAR
jgi:malonyl-CoA decarboxylase